MGPSGLTVAAAAIAAAALGLGLWLVAAAALAALVIVRRDPAGPFADVIVFLGLVPQADLLWVALLIAGSIAAREADPRSRLVLLLAAVAAIFVHVDWTILTGLLALIALFRAGARLLRAARASRYQR